MNLNNQIDWNDTDRIVSNDTRYVSLSGDWWRESSSWQTRQNGSSALTRVGLTRTRLTGLANNGEAVLSCNGEANLTFRFGSYYFASDLFDSTAAGGLANLETYATLHQIAANGEEAEDLVSATTNQVYLARSPETFAYDDDGNQTLIATKTGLWRVTYNGENRPILWVCDSGNTALVMNYDHMGRRRAKNDQRFFYDGCLQVADNSGNVYSWDCTENVATRPLAWCNCAFDTPHSALYYTHDGNKNVSEVASAQCDLSAHYEYAPFGAVILQQGESAATNPWRFSSEFAEEDIMTIYYNYRHYEPVMGRWQMPFQTCRDRAKEALGDCCLKVGRKMDTTTRGVLKVEFYK